MIEREHEVYGGAFEVEYGFDFNKRPAECELRVHNNMREDEDSRHDHHFQLVLEGCHGDTFQASTESESSQRPDQSWEGQIPAYPSATTKGCSV